MHEEAVLLHKGTGAYLLEDSFYGEASCGAISATNDWAVVAGEHVTVWRARVGITVLNAPADLQWVHALRVDEGIRQVQLLTDPWGEHPAIWELNPLTLTVQKLRNFPDYQEREYVEEVSW
ncbi:MAG: hypothetical protein EOO60_12985 [Hymenobacter sp.]|nr:MAG: hypothetical protein EOO60_12985 [Hymenobacter sp.]